MFRSVLFLLLAVPMLVPQGICLCRLSAALPIAATSDDEAGCRCGDPGCSREQPAVTESDCEPAPFTDHAPSCPATPTIAVARAVSHQTHHDVAAFDIAAFAEVPAFSILVDTAPQPLAESSPLFADRSLTILCCNFRC